MTEKNITASERNEAVYKMLKIFLSDEKTVTTFDKPFSSDLVEPLFQTSIWGHREIVLTIILARLFEPKFKASHNFYACNPRSLFEKPIRKALREYGIPHRKSGPLNVAKNTKKINRDWAADKHGGEIAMIVVELVKLIEKVSKSDLKNFFAAYVRRYRQEAKKVKELRVNLPPEENPIIISKLCVDLINNVPDGGATAQIIVGLLMETYAKDRGSKVEISGHKDSVSTTNTTSKKAGDIIEKINAGAELIYEITTKLFSDDRLIESYEAVMVYNNSIKTVFVICRPKDVPETLSHEGYGSFILAHTQYKELAYFFIDIYEYLQSMILFMSPNAKKAFYKKLISYVNDLNTSEKVKKYFKKWHDENKL